MGMKLAHSLKRGKNKMTDLIQLGKQAKSASSQLALLETSRKNDLLEKLNELCENQDLEILITYEKFRSSNSFYELHLYPNLQKIVNANMQ